MSIDLPRLRALHNAWSSSPTDDYDTVSALNDGLGAALEEIERMRADGVSEKDADDAIELAEAIVIEQIARWLESDDANSMSVQQLIEGVRAGVWKEQP